MSIKFPAFLFICTCGALLAGNLFVFGTFDLNNNGKSEVLLLGGLSNQLEYIELGDGGSHNLLWSFSPKNGSKVTDAKLTDLNHDGKEELIIVLASNQDRWLGVFEWNGVAFSSNPKLIQNKDIGGNRIRPGNIWGSLNNFAVSMSTPTRSVELFSLSLEEGALQKTNSYTLSSALVNNGYGPVYTGVFSNEKESFVSLMSPEGNVLKTSVFSVTNPNKAVASDLLVLNGARAVLGQYIQPFDENKDGVEELLVPFATGEVYALALKDSVLTFTESRLSQSGLFDMKSSAGEVEINRTILSRVERGLYDSVLKNSRANDSDSLSFLVTDTLLLGDSLNLFILPDSTSDFYGFKWRTTPPSEMRFDPNVYKIRWVPTRENIGLVDASFSLNVRIKEELLSEKDSLGDTHQIHPVLQTIDSSLVLVVSDTIVPPKPFMVVPPRFHRINISTADIDENDRFVFEGETPFSANSINTNGVVSIGVSADLSTIKHNKKSAFNFKSSFVKPSSIVTLSLIHDLGSNILYASIFPSQDTVPQSFDPEGFHSDLYRFPEYFFEGFRSTLSLDSIPNGHLSLLSSNEKISGTVSLSSPLRRQDHSMTISYFGGRPYAIRGDVGVKESGAQKIITEIDFESSFVPFKIDTWLTPANRDTFVFHADSIPDTLKANADFHSFYAPAIKLKEKTTVDNLVGDVAPSNHSVEDKIQIPKNDGLSPAIDNINKTVSDSVVIMPVDSINSDIDTLSITPIGPIPITTDSIKTDMPVVSSDST